MDEICTRTNTLTLLNLPAEIRAEIYLHVYSTAVVRVHIRDGPCQSACHRGTPFWGINLLLANRTLYNECRFYFYEATFIFTLDGLHGKKSFSAVPSSITSPMRRVAIKPELACDIISWSRVKLSSQFPSLQLLKIWAECEPSIEKYFEDFKSCMHEDKKCRWQIVYKGNHSRLAYTAIINDKWDAYVFARRYSLPETFKKQVQQLFDLSLDKFRFINTIGYDCTPLWDTIIDIP